MSFHVFLPGEIEAVTSIFFEHDGTSEQIPHEQAACSHPGPKPLAHLAQFRLLYGHVVRVLQVRCEHGAI